MAKLRRAKTETDAEFDALPETPVNASKRKGKIAALNRLSKLCIAIGRTLHLSGVTLNDGTTVRGAGMRKALHTGWAPTFAKSEVDEHLGKLIAERFCSEYDWSLFTDAEISDFLNFLSKVPHSAPGPDGIPYIAWRMAGYEGAETLYLLYLLFNSGAPPPLRALTRACLFSPPRGLTPLTAPKL